MQFGLNDVLLISLAAFWRIAHLITNLLWYIGYWKPSTKLNVDVLCYACEEDFVYYVRRVDVLCQFIDE